MPMKFICGIFCWLLIFKKIGNAWAFGMVFTVEIRRATFLILSQPKQFNSVNCRFCGWLFITFSAFIHVQRCDFFSASFGPRETFVASRPPIKFLRKKSWKSGLGVHNLSYLWPIKYKQTCLELSCSFLVFQSFILIVEQFWFSHLLLVLLYLFLTVTQEFKLNI